MTFADFIQHIFLFIFRDYILEVVNTNQISIGIQQIFPDKRWLFIVTESNKIKILIFVVSRKKEHWMKSLCIFTVPVIVYVFRQQEFNNNTTFIFVFFLPNQ